MTIRMGAKLMIRRTPTAPAMLAYVDSLVANVGDGAIGVSVTITIIDPENTTRPDEQVTVGICLLAMWVTWGELQS